RDLCLRGPGSRRLELDDPLTAAVPAPVAQGVSTGDDVRQVPPEQALCVAGGWSRIHGRDSAGRRQGSAWKQRTHLRIATPEVVIDVVERDVPVLVLSQDHLDAEIVAGGKRASGLSHAAVWPLMEDQRRHVPLDLISNLGVSNSGGGQRTQY